MKYILGLDLGIDSLGWAIIKKSDFEKDIFTTDEDLNNYINSLKIIDMGSYIYSDGRDPQKKTSLCAEKTKNRGVRKLKTRKILRLGTLRNELVKLKLFPSKMSKRIELKKLNVYELRDKAIKEEITDYELGRILYNIAKHRGFKSNRKNKGEMKALQENVNNAKKMLENYETIGSFLYDRLKNNQSTRIKDDVNLYFLREQYENEFDKIKECQFKYHNLTEKQWQDLKNIIFNQRKLQPQEVGKCEILGGNYKRISKALPTFQKSRILQDINNLTYKYGYSGKYTKLNEEQREKLFNILNKEQKEITFSSIASKLGLNKDQESLPDLFGNLKEKQNNIIFNLEKRKSIKGNSTAILLSKKEYFGKLWHDIDDKTQDEIVSKILKEENENELINYLKQFNISDIQIENIINLDDNKFDSGYGNLSQEVLLKILPYLKEGYFYNEAIELAGFGQHSNFYTGEIVEKLPYYGKILNNYTQNVKYGTEEEKKNGKISNPSVHIGLNRLRIVVNELIKKYGVPDQINIEFGRELRLGTKGLKELEKEQNNNEKNNEKIVKILKENNVTISRENIIKYKLWEELGGEDFACCIYTGKAISIHDLFSSNVEIEHILPYSRTLDDSFNNKTLSYSSANKVKTNQTPYEAFANNQNYNYNEIINRAEKRLKNKSWRFQSDAMEKFNNKDDFLARAMNDTKYLSRVARQYLLPLLGKTPEGESRINAIKGQLTSKIRKYLGLNNILSNVEEKNRNDHRHHAIDAVVIGYIDKRIIQRLSHVYDSVDKHKNIIDKRFNNIREQLYNMIDKINVYHRMDHSINGEINEATNYGIDLTDEERESGFNVYRRKKTNELSKKEISAIRDLKIRNQLMELTKNIENEKDLKLLLNDYSVSHNIKRIRVLKTDNPIFIIKSKSDDGKEHCRAIVSGRNHHISYWQLDSKTNIEKMKSYCDSKNFYLWVSKDKKYCATCYSYFVINKYKKELGLKSNEDVIKNVNFLKPCPSAKLIMHLYGGDLIKAKINGEEGIFRITKLNPSADRIVVLNYLNSQTTKTILEKCKNNPEKLEKIKKETEVKEESLSFSLFKEKQVRKIYISPIGELYDNNKWYE